MKLSRLLMLVVLIAAPTMRAANNNLTADRAWKPFFTSFRAAVKKRDRAALRTLMSADFFSSGGNSEGAEAAFTLWDDPHVRGWDAFNRVLSQGTVPKAAWWNAGRSQYIGRVAPPAANIRRNVKRGVINWYAIFEFRDGRWYCTVFNQCCD